MTESSLSKSAEMQDRMTEAHERHQEVVKKLQTSEEAKRKMKYELQQLQMQVHAHAQCKLYSELQCAFVHICGTFCVFEFVWV